MKRFTGSVGHHTAGSCYLITAGPSFITKKLKVHDSDTFSKYSCHRNILRESNKFIRRKAQGVCSISTASSEVCEHGVQRALPSTDQ